jgi:hypothetical protein
MGAEDDLLLEALLCGVAHCPFDRLVREWGSIDLAVTAILPVARRHGFALVYTENESLLLVPAPFIVL